SGVSRALPPNLGAEQRAPRSRRDSRARAAERRGGDLPADRPESPVRASGWGGTPLLLDSNRCLHVSKLSRRAMGRLLRGVERRGLSARAGLPARRRRVPQRRLRPLPSTKTSGRAWVPSRGAGAVVRLAAGGGEALG